jgi:hypothetical protein
MYPVPLVLGDVAPLPDVVAVVVCAVVLELDDFPELDDDVVVGSDPV